MFKQTGKKAVVLLSGGIDSSTTLSIAKIEGFELYALTFDYGQRHKLEIESAKMVAESLGVKKHLTIKFDLREIGGSALTSDVEVPKSQILNLKSEIPITYVPARNTIFLSFALAWAETLEAADIFLGANAVDYSGYPDCRPEYLSAFEETANLATRISVEGRLKFRINAPLLYLTKGEIIKKGIDTGLDYALTWSCYDPQPLNTKLEIQNSKLQFLPCRRCDSCLFRAKGFIEAGIEDPLFTRQLGIKQANDIQQS